MKLGPGVGSSDARRGCSSTARRTSSTSRSTVVVAVDATLVGATVEMMGWSRFYETVSAEIYGLNLFCQILSLQL
jgi:hypothetical protein